MASDSNDRVNQLNLPSGEASKNCRSKDESTDQGESGRAPQYTAALHDHPAPERIGKLAESKFDTLHRETSEKRKALRQVQKDNWEWDIAAKREYIRENFPRADPSELERPPLDDIDIMRRALAHTDRDIPITDMEMDRLTIAMVKHDNDWNDALLDLHYQHKLGFQLCPEDLDEARTNIKSLPEQAFECNSKREFADTLNQSRPPDPQSELLEVNLGKNLVDGPERGR